MNPKERIDRITHIGEKEPVGEAYKVEMYQKGTDRRSAVIRLTNLIKSNDNKPLAIKSKDGEEGYISIKSIHKLVSDTAVEKSVANGFTREQHFAVASDIDNLFKNSIKVSTHPDNKGRRGITAIHRFVTPLYGNNVAYITVREIKENGKKIYSVELMEMGKLEGMHGVKLNSTPEPATSLPNHNIEKN